MNVGDRIRVGDVSGSGNQIGSRGNTYNVGAAVAPGQSGGEPAGAGPRHSLYAFADIVGYSQLSARLQKDSQDYLLGLLNESLTEAGVAPQLVAAQNQGDARLLWFPAATDAARVLAMMPRYLNDNLLDRNQDMAPHAQLRVRLSLTMGVAEAGGLGQAGGAPIAVVRLGNAAPFRRIMKAAPLAQCGLIIDSHLYSEYVLQRFRADISPADFTPVHVSDPEKAFEASAWIRLFGYSSAQMAALIA